MVWRDEESPDPRPGVEGFSPKQIRPMQSANPYFNIQLFECRDIGEDFFQANSGLLRFTVRR
jgi:hypothetical protein